MRSKKILVAGASVAGNTVAWWLSRKGFEVTVVEKANCFREGGQNVDVRGNGREVLRRMGLEQAALDLNTGEVGTDWVDDNDNIIARFAIADLGAEGPTAELEIMRGDIARLIYEPARQQANYVFGESISAFEQDDSGVTVTFTTGRQARYDLVVVAEGVGSSTRELIFPGENQIRSMDLTVAFFDIPKKETDSEFARQYNTIGGRGVTLKPGRDGKLHVYLGVHKKPAGENKWDVEQQKAFMRRQFAGDGWELPRILKGMTETDNFYFDVFRQVRMKHWSKSRIVLTGDAAWCPTGLSGVGTTLAIVGGYVLAGELSKTDDHVAAFAAYERIMRPFVKEGQSVPKPFVRFLWPHSQLGLRIFRALMWLAGRPALRKAFNQIYLRDSKKIALPDYN
ncbi:FAD-dependent monooxygenase [Spirosoma pomorum]